MYDQQRELEHPTLPQEASRLEEQPVRGHRTARGTLPDEERRLEESLEAVKSQVPGWPVEEQGEAYYDLDLGDTHWLSFTCWEPDDLPQNRVVFKIPDGQPMPRIERVGGIIYHKRPDTGAWCMGAIHFDSPEVRKFWNMAKTTVWQVQSFEPLTCSPLFLCLAPDASGKCNDHGFIRGGKWVRA